MKTSELIGAQLDWAVAKADENLYPKGNVLLLDGKVFTIEAGDWDTPDRWQRYSPSTSWVQGGTLIEEEKITITPLFFMEGGWRANHHNLRYDDMGEYIDGSDGMQDGPTALIAAMRCFCASRLGDEINIPEELL